MGLYRMHKMTIAVLQKRGKQRKHLVLSEILLLF